MVVGGLLWEPDLDPETSALRPGPIAGLDLSWVEGRVYKVGERITTESSVSNVVTQTSIAEE